MIQLTRLRHGDSFLLNPDFIERVDSYVDTIVRLVTGVEYVVEEPADEIARRIIAYRSSILAALPDLQDHRTDPSFAAIAATSSTAGALALEETES